MSENDNNNKQKSQQNEIDTFSLQQAASGACAVVSDMSETIGKKIKECLDDNTRSSFISGGIDSLTGKRLNELAAMRRVELRDKLGNIFLESRKVTTGGKIAGWVSKNSPLGTAGTTIYGLYKDVTKYSGADLMMATLLTMLATYGGIKTGSTLERWGATTPVVLGAGGVVGTWISNETDKIKDSMCTEDVKPGKTDIPPTV